MAPPSLIDPDQSQARRLADPETDAKTYKKLGGFCTGDFRPQPPAPDDFP